MLELPSAFEPWMPNSRCYTDPPKDPEMFFEKGRKEEAVEFCRGCVERGHCLSWAMRLESTLSTHGPETQALQGIAGGLSRSERRHLQRKWDKALSDIQEQLKVLQQDGRKYPNAS